MPKLGDNVRLKLDTESLDQEFVKNSLTHKSVGYIVEMEKDGTVSNAKFFPCHL